MRTHSLAVAISLAPVFFFATAPNQAQAQLGKAEVKGVQGLATYTYGGGSPMQVRRGLALPSGAVLRVDRDSAVDLYLGPEAGTIRVTQNSLLTLNKLDSKQTQLTLSEGQLVGWDARIPATSQYEVKLPNGIVGIVQGKYRLDARSYLVLLDGAMAYAYAPPGGQPTPFMMRAPPPVYFSPAEGVRPAPAMLEREVQLQTKGKLR